MNIFFSSKTLMYLLPGSARIWQKRPPWTSLPDSSRREQGQLHCSVVVFIYLLNSYSVCKTVQVMICRVDPPTPPPLISVSLFVSFCLSLFLSFSPSLPFFFMKENGECACPHHPNVHLPLLLSWTVDFEETFLITNWWWFSNPPTSHSYQLVCRCYSCFYSTCTMLWALYM